MAVSLDAPCRRAIDRLNAHDMPAPLREKLCKVAIASDFAIDTLVRQPALLTRLLADDGVTASAPPILDMASPHEWQGQLRRWRQAESTRLIWRDVLGLDTVDVTLAASSRIAEACLTSALSAIEARFAAEHGLVRNAQGQTLRLVVFGLGKLGGGELNFSSDIDLVYAYEEEGESDGRRPLDAERYFTRQGQQLARLLDEVTADGFCHRVDLRLRPYGGAGRVAWSFPALELYFQREGRDWERYAWQKARPVAGDIAAGERFLAVLRPFVYRRYLDFGALEGVREMKALIQAEVERKDRADDIKRGAGGIREIEFLVQALQLIRAGRDLHLQVRGLMPALRALMDAGQIGKATGALLMQHYRFLRQLENRLQMMRDAQTHDLPEDADNRLRLARGLGYADWQALREKIDQVRQAVSAEFAGLLARRRQQRPGALAEYWQQLPDAGNVDVLIESGYEQAAALDAQLRDFLRSATVRQSAEIGRIRLNRVMPALLAACAQSAIPDAALQRALLLVQNILRRSSYLALLDEQPQALTRLVDALSRSALLGERLANYPLLLDELLDSRSIEPIPSAAALQADFTALLAQGEGDTDSVLNRLNEARQAISFRIALAALDGRQSSTDSTGQLARLADAVLGAVLTLAWQAMRHQHGEVPGARFAILGYGSLGGEELGFGSDLDLVFIHDAPADAESDGARPLDAARWFARLAQKIVGFLQTPTAAGRLFDVDVRLRPDGSKAMLVSTLASFADYQQQRAWTWERQALIRARCVAGDASLAEDFEVVRRAVLSQPRVADDVRRDVCQMRARARAELDRSDAMQLDLKQGEGGLVDLEFLLQGLVLCHARENPALTNARSTASLIEALHAAGIFTADEADSLSAAHRTLLETSLACMLDRRKRIAPRSEVIDKASADIGRLWQAKMA